MARRSSQRRKSGGFVRVWLPLFLYVTMIFVLSAQPRLYAPPLFPNIDKLAHTVEYGILGVLIARALGDLIGLSRAGVVALLAVCVGIVIGTADELFQSKVPGRESDPYDLMADTIGLTLGQLVFRATRR